jgi:restriction system protein
MPVPDYQDLMLPVLTALADGTEHKIAELRDQIANKLQLTAEDRAAMLPSGQQPIFDNRVGWAKTYLVKAGMLAIASRGTYRITELGKSLLAQKPARVDKALLLQQSETFKVFLETDAAESTTAAPVRSASQPAHATPEEVLDGAYSAVRSKVESELLESVRNASPKFFERMVVELLVQMGYGGSREDASRALTVGKSHDGGIDGIIKEDHLGLDAIYVQAKRWQATVGRPEVQAFAGSLEGERARKGIMLTTSTFSAEAAQYVKKIEKKIVLIDGRQLAGLMFDFGVGVSDVNQYRIKRVDSDYFTEE